MAEEKESLFTAFEEPEKRVRTKRKAPWDQHDSIALVASNGYSGCILAYDGDGIEADIEAIGEGGRLEDHGLDHAPEGLSIWEGDLRCESCSYEYPSEVDCYLDGTFRELTPEEWEEYRLTGEPWQYLEGTADAPPVELNDNLPT